MPDFHEVCRTTDIADPGKAYYEVEDSLVVLFHVDNEFFCIDDICTHDGGPLGEGQLEDHTIACPRHGAKFCIRSGKALTLPATQPTVAHEVKVEGDHVWVKLGSS